VEAIIRGRDTCTPTGVGQSSMQGDEQGALLHQAWQACLAKRN
jgi:hypothetical protein